MPVINISVENKIAEADGTLYVCGNSDFVAKFAFDAEWEAYETKTARFGYNNSYVDVVFTGDKCPVPIISGTYFFNIGVYAGDLHTTTPARVPCKKSILCDTGFPADPPNDVYNQIMEKLNSLESADPEAIAKAVANYLAEHPVEETDPTVPEWAKAEITGATVGQIAKITAVDASGVPTAWSPVDMPSGGGETWEKIAEIELRADTAEYVLADFATWRKAKVIMTRPQYVSGLSKNVWCRVAGKNFGDTYACGYLIGAYGYIYWEFSAEVTDLFVLSNHIESNNRMSSTNVTSTGTFMMLASPAETYKFKLAFTDTSVIQAGDKVTVIGVRR